MIFAAAQLSAQEAKNASPEYTKEYVNKVNRIAESFGLGYEIGYWAPSVAIGINALVPVGDTWGMEFRFFSPQGYMSVPYKKGYDPTLSFSIGYFKRTPVFMGLIRVYFGGYMSVGYRIRDVEPNIHAKEPIMDKKNERIGFAGGGKLGIEFFVSEKKAYFIEVGGQGPTHAYQYDAGGMVMAGAHIYFGK